MRPAPADRLATAAGTHDESPCASRPVRSSSTAAANGVWPIIDEYASWHESWLLSVPIITLNVIIHVYGLVRIDTRLVPFLVQQMVRRSQTTRLCVIMGVTAFLATILHAIEGATWAGAYLTVGALPKVRLAMLYSINAMTTYGHISTELDTHWRMMGALEALNGIILFGLTTAFMFAILQRVSVEDPHPRRRIRGS
jgi:hypothetical protein